MLGTAQGLEGKKGSRVASVVAVPLLLVPVLVQILMTESPETRAIWCTANHNDYSTACSRETAGGDSNWRIEYLGCLVERYQQSKINMFVSSTDTAFSAVLALAVVILLFPI